jgi:Type III restriction enzyme, res subunit/Helicase conserved C-terminal domain
MINLTYPELAEISNKALPPASLDALKSIRNQMCESSKSTFSLQSQQKFLRRVLSPDSPVRSLLMFHGTGVGKTCTAIQVAEEYILRPEFQDKKVLIVASAAVQDNFRTQIFDMSRVNLNPISGILQSQQCTGRRYLDMLLRIENEPKNWNNPEIRDRLERTSKKLIDEFYEFSAYISFGNMLNEKLTGTEADIDKQWVHDTFDNRLVIIDEAHNLRGRSDGVKGVTEAMEKLVKIADNMTLVFLSATPMYDTFEEIVFFMNVCLWNDRRQPPTQSIQVGDIFNPDATIKPGNNRFRDWCSEYVSYVKGESPFTFPFRLPPPKYVTTNLSKSFLGKSIGNEERLQYISLVPSQAKGIQQEFLLRTESVETEDEEKRRVLMESTIVVLPEGKRFEDVFRKQGKKYEYTNDKWLSKENLPNHSAKYATIIETLVNSKGVCLVYSNFKKYGATLFAMALEEHGFQPVSGEKLLANPAYEGSSKGTYALLTSDASESEISKLLSAAKSPNNRDGNQIRVIISSPIVSEGVDFRYMRQVHIVDPWWNASRIEQVVGRGLRTCSHQLLPFEEQNCTVYYHVVRAGERECYDEYTYRTRVVPKAVKIARVRKVMAESAMDCPLQNTLNTLPDDWKQLEIPQKRPEGSTASYRLVDMLGPTFDDTPDVTECATKPSVPDPEHVRPLSTYLDVRDELLTKLARLLIDKPIWDREELLVALRPYTKDVILFNLQQAISSGTKFEDSFGRASVIESKGDLYALAPIGVPNATLIERTQKPPVQGRVPLPVSETPKEQTKIEIAEDILDIKRDAFEWPLDAKTRFGEMTLNGYIFDHVFTDEEKRSYLATRPTNLPFASRLYVPETDLIVMGKDTFEPPREVVFEEKTRYQEWTDALLEQFISKKDQVFATLNAAGKLAIARMKLSEGPLQRESNIKRFEPIACGTGDYAKDNIVLLSKKIDKNGKGVPETFEVNGKQRAVRAGDMCVYLELLLREENNCFWLTPEEYKVLYDGPGSKKDQTNQYKISQAFKK